MCATFDAKKDLRKECLLGICIIHENIRTFMNIHIYVFCMVRLELFTAIYRVSTTLQLQYVYHANNEKIIFFIFHEKYFPIITLSYFQFFIFTSAKHGSVFISPLQSKARSVQYVRPNLAIKYQMIENIFNYCA